MGRKTFESLGRPLPNRLNIVLTRQGFEDYENVRWARNPETALLIADVHTICALQPEFFVIGGEVIFKEFHKYINQFWLTEVNTGPINGDAKFDYDFPISEWRTREETEYPAGDHDDYSFRITHYVRRKFEHRVRSKDEFMPNSPEVLNKIDEWHLMIEAVARETDTSGGQATLF